MKYWLDTEFIERPCTIDLISIGIVAEDGREFYGESSEVDWSQASEWVLQHVRPQLISSGADARGLYEHEDRNVYVGGTRALLGKAILLWLGHDATPEFWAYYADYDWVAFCWLFGTMLDLPGHFPMFCRDVKQLAVDLGSPALPPQDSAEHHALADARWTRDAWQFLNARR